MLDSQRPAVIPSGNEIQTPADITICKCKAGGKPSTWFPPGGLAEWLQANSIDTHRTTQAHRNYNIAQKKENECKHERNSKRTNERRNEETNKKTTREPTNVRTNERNKKTTPKALRYEYATGIRRADKKCMRAVNRSTMVSARRACRDGFSKTKIKHAYAQLTHTTNATMTRTNGC